MGMKKGRYHPNVTNYRRKYTGTMGGTGIKNMTIRPNAVPLSKKIKKYRFPSVPG
jgi:hypothetical protein